MLLVQNIPETKAEANLMKYRNYLKSVLGKESKIS